jgi:septation ring formation regulator EzrA
VTISAIEQQLKQFEKDVDWIFSRYSELANKYPEEYVAVHECKLVDHGNDLNRLMERLRAKYGEAATSMAVQYVSPRNDEWVL